MTLVTTYKYKLTLKEILNDNWGDTVTVVPTINSYADLVDSLHHFYTATITRLLGATLSTDVFKIPATLSANGDMFENTLATNNDAWAIMFYKYLLPQAMGKYITVYSSIDMVNLEDIKNDVINRFVEIFLDSKDLYYQRVCKYLDIYNDLMANASSLILENGSTGTSTNAAANDTHLSKYSDTPTTTLNPTGNKYATSVTENSDSVGARSLTTVQASTEDIRYRAAQDLYSNLHSVFSEWAKHVAQRLTVDAEAYYSDNPVAF